MRLVLVLLSVTLTLVAKAKHIKENTFVLDRHQEIKERVNYLTNGILEPGSQQVDIESEDEAKEAEIIMETERRRNQQRGKQMNHNRRKRYVHLEAPLWEAAIVPYQFHNITSSQEETVLDAMYTIQNYTCVRFYLEGSGEYSVSHDAYLSFMKLSGCWAWLGQYRAGQEISPCTQFNTILHEIMHALGVYHEQERKDRDLYVQLNLGNVKAGFEDNFDIPEYTAEFLKSPFDLQSIMLYGDYTFSIERNVKKTLDPYSDDVAKKRNGYWNLMKEINEAYKCIDKCTSPPTCANGGYPGYPNGACGCICPENLDPADNCASLQSGVGGGIHYLSTSTPVVQFTTPDAPNSGIPASSTYMWIFFAPEDGSKVVVDIEALNADGNIYTCHASLWINRDLIGQPGNAYCGNGYSRSIISLGNVVVITLDAGQTSTSYVKGTATLRPADQWCYTLSNYGETYNGSKAHAVTNDPCLPWSQAAVCEYYPANMRLQASYDNNYCRNPEGMLNQPWCYTEIGDTSCVITFCDVCDYGKPYDVHDNCAALEPDPLYCVSDDAAYGCRATCRLDEELGPTSPTTSPTSPTTSPTSPTTSPTSPTTSPTSPTTSPTSPTTSPTSPTTSPTSPTTSPTSPTTSPTSPTTSPTSPTTSPTSPTTSPTSPTTSPTSPTTSPTSPTTSPTSPTTSPTSPTTSPTSPTTSPTSPTTSPTSPTTSPTSPTTSPTSPTTSPTSPTTSPTSPTTSPTSPTTSPTSPTTSPTSPTTSPTSPTTSPTSPTTSPTSPTTPILPELPVNKKPVCSTGYTEFSGDGMCYRYVSERKTPSSAQLACESESAELTSVESKELDDFLINLRRNAGFPREKITINVRWDTGLLHWYWVPLGRNTEIIYNRWARRSRSGTWFLNCAVIDKENKGSMWRRRSCWGKAHYVCRKAPENLITRRKRDVDCEDERDECLPFILGNPDVCTSHLAQLCRKTCGMCNPEGLTCSVPEPEAGENVDLVTTATTLTPGQVAEYKCLPDFYPESGTGRRACLLDGSLTGEMLVCTDISETTSQVNNLQLIPMLDVPVGLALFGPSMYTNINRTGEISQWMAFCAVEGDAYLMVLRQTTATSVTIVGMNRVTCMNNRKMTWTVDEDERIEVQPGDFLGVWDPAGSHLQFNWCDAQPGSSFGFMTYASITDEQPEEGDTIPVGNHECLVIVVNALIVAS